MKKKAGRITPTRLSQGSPKGALLDEGTVDGRGQLRSVGLIREHEAKGSSSLGRDTTFVEVRAQLLFNGWEYEARHLIGGRINIHTSISSDDVDARLINSPSSV